MPLETQPHHDASKEHFSNPFGQGEMLRTPITERGGMEGGEEAVRRLAEGKGKTFDIPTGEEQNFMFWVGVFNALRSEIGFTRDLKRKMALETATKAALDVRDKLKNSPTERVDVQPAKTLIERSFATVQ